MFVSDDQCIPSVETVALPAGVVAPGEIAARAERDAEVVALRRAEERVAAAIDADGRLLSNEIAGEQCMRARAVVDAARPLRCVDVDRTAEATLRG